MTNIGQVYKYPMENQFNLKGKVEIAIMTWESSWQYENTEDKPSILNLINSTEVKDRNKWK